MMKALKTLAMTLGLLAAAGCSDHGFIDEGIGPVVTGSVTTEDGSPIEHIQVTLDWTDSGIKGTSYTSSEGIFTSSAYLSRKGETLLKIKLEDIDGEENGGLFETLEETLTLLEEEYAGYVTESGEINLRMAFRLNRATP